MRIEVIDAGQADLDEIVALAREAFVGVTGTSSFVGVMRKIVSSDHLRMKYDTPFGPAKIATAREGGRLVATNAMIPCRLVHDAGQGVGWQSCDTATHPQARGRGLFKKCVSALTQQLNDGAVFFGYPNANSRRGLESVGWRQAALLHACVNVVPMPRASEDVQQVSRFDASQDELADRLVPPGGVMIQRSSDYLNWRYRLPASDTYAAFVHRAGGRSEGFAVARRLGSGWRRMGMLMELFGTSRAIESALVAASLRWCREAAPLPVMMLSSSGAVESPWRHGFIRVPAALSPRRLVLLGAGVGDAGARAMKSQWRATVGDWDVF